MQFVLAAHLRHGQCPPPHTPAPQDLSSLIYLEEPHVVHNLRCRYASDLIYTGISSVLVAVNPYKELKCYGNDMIRHYACKAKYEKGMPHVYNVAEQAYRQLLWTGTNQSMVVCGESGAGKTENAKYLMRHLAYTTSMGLYKSSRASIGAGATEEQTGALTSAKIEQQILAANPILESMGNAKTLLNNNSSRFGKFTKLLFDTPQAVEKGSTEGGRIVGSAMETYLLEKSRVVFQAPGERNYHVFYQLCAGLPSEDLANLGIESPEEFSYLNQGDCVEIPGMSDELRFNEMLKAMELLGFDAKSRSSLFSGVAAVMHIGNIEFEPDESKHTGGCRVTEDSQDYLRWAARLLGITAEQLTARLVSQSIKVRGKKIFKDYDVAAAESNRDSTAKALYSSMFDWVVLTINKELFLKKLERERQVEADKQAAEEKKKEQEAALKREEEMRLRKLKEAEAKLSPVKPTLSEPTAEADSKPNKKKKKKGKLGNKFAMFENNDDDDDLPPPPIRRRRRKKKKKAASAGGSDGSVGAKAADEADEKGSMISMDALDSDPNISWIGILDVFGFECFEYNSFEQFCINFTNETLQRFFNYNIMLSEQAEYQREGIFWTPIELPDNKDTLDLIANKHDGIFHLLDQAGLVPKGDDKTFTALLFKEHGYHPRLREMNTNPRAKHRGRRKDRINGFQISHYAMPVVYNAKDFLVKNKDRVHEDSVELFCGSKSPFVGQLLRSLRGKKSKKRTLGFVFTEQLRRLMKNLNKTKPYFVRCIKPNLAKQAGNIVKEYVGSQLRCGGLIEAIRIIKCGYPTRVEYEAIFQRYAPSVFKSQPKKLESTNRRDFCEAILRAFEKNRSHFEMGLTKVFFKGGQEQFLEDLMRKGGKNWVVPPDLVEKIRKHILRKRIQRFCAFTRAFARWSVRLRRLRAAAKLRKWVRIQVILNKTIYKSLARARAKIASVTAAAALRTAAAVQRFRRTRRAVLYMQRTFRSKRTRSQLILELQRRIQRKRDAQEALASNRASALGSDEVLRLVAAQAATWLRQVVFHSVKDNLFDGLSDGVALCQMVEKIRDSGQGKMQDKKAGQGNAFQYYAKASEGSSLAKRNIEAAIVGLKRLGVPEQCLFSVDDLALLKSPRRVLNAVAAACALAEIRERIPGIPAFPTVKFEIDEQRIAGREDADIVILLFGEGGALEDPLDIDRKKELIQPGYLDKKREMERKAMEHERERKRRLAEILEKERVAKQEAAERERKMKEDREKFEREKAEFMAWKKAKEEREQAKEAEAQSTNEAKKAESSTPAAAAPSAAAAAGPTATTNPDLDQKRQFFALSVTAVLRRFEEHGLLTAAGLGYDDFNSNGLFEQSGKEGVPWHMWNDWLLQRVRARIDARISEKPVASRPSADARRQQPLPPLPLVEGDASDKSPPPGESAAAAPTAQPAAQTPSRGVSFHVRRSGDVSVKYIKGAQVHEQYKVVAARDGRAKPRRKGAAKRSIIVSIAGPKPPPPRRPPPKNAKRYHRRRGSTPSSSLTRTPPSHLTSPAPAPNRFVTPSPQQRRASTTSGGGGRYSGASSAARTGGRSGGRSGMRSGGRSDKRPGSSTRYNPDAIPRDSSGVEKPSECVLA